MSNDTAGGTALERLIERLDSCTINPVFHRHYGITERFIVENGGRWLAEKVT